MPGDAGIAHERPGIEAGDAAISDLPLYARGLLKIRVPVRVTLASQRKPIQEIIELGPGSIVKFDKTCDEPLELCVGDRPIATGEVVKVGDKFGLRVGGLLAP
jgi:flagellar motor switch protein FliN/FliY